MNWVDKWRAISARIDGIMRAGEFYLMSVGAKSSDHHGVVGKSIIPELNAIVYELKELYEKHETELPLFAGYALKNFLSHQWETKIDVFLKALVPFQAFRTEFEYLIKDTEMEVRNLTELAFEHLRRLIVVSQEVRHSWISAFDDRENACEKLGAVHLLSHGIWAFKASAPGGATDLVYNEPLQGHFENIRRTARGLVLTEWKKVTSANELEKKAEEARTQTSSYSSGVLGGMELKGTRYVVLVSKDDLCPPEDVVQHSVTYRHIVIPIEPKSPSAAARKKAARS